MEYDLNDRIKLIYDYLYNNNTKSCFTFNTIELGKISINDIKIPLPIDIQDEIDYYNINKTNVLNGRFKMLLYKDNTILLKRYSDLFPVNMKISFYKNRDTINSLKNSINNESLFSYLLSYLVISKKTKHILLPLMNIDVNLVDIENIIDNITLSTIKNNILNGEIINICCLQLKEHFFRTQNLKDYILENKCNYKLLIFQVLHTLAVIQSNYNGFTHNNLKLDNILLYLKKDSNTYIEYEGFKDNKYYIPDTLFDIKITNFDNSTLPNYYGNTKNNAYYDIYTFLNDLINNTKCDVETNDFLNRIIPKNIRNKKNVDNIINPIDLLEDKYFDEYKHKTDKISTNIFTNHKYYTSLNILNTNIDSDNNSILGKQYKLKSNINIMNNEIDKKILSLNKRILKGDILLDKLNRMNINDKLNNMVGGNVIVPPYRAEKNTPFLSNEQRDISRKRAEENPVREPPVLLEQKVYDRTPPPSKPQYPPTFIPLYDPEGQMMNSMLPYSNRVVNQPPVQKTYNISLTNPLHGFTTLNRIYEDTLPGDPYNYTSLTIYERTELMNFLRNKILTHFDGEEMVTIAGNNSLLEYLKILDLNPYTTNKNPYSNLPINFLLYRAGYPIRYDENRKVINLSRNSLGLNIRIYMLTIGDLDCKSIDDDIKCNQFDVWREVKYYDYIKNNIIMKKKSPNFILPILYKIDSLSKINWDKLHLLRKQREGIETLIKLQENQKKLNEKHKMEKQLGIFSKLLPPYTKLNNKKDIIVEKDNKEDITRDSGKSLVYITEAPTTTIIQWASSMYESHGSVKRMISRGHHSKEVWYSILFQLVYSFTILQEEEIFINNMSLENNVYIKDIYYDANAVGSWIYQINNIKYYIPNYGYILMLDTKYNDININEINNEKVYKIYGRMFNEDKFNNIELKEHIYNTFKKLINPANFGHEFRLNGGMMPNTEILQFLDKLYNDTETNIKNYILKHFKMYVNNRIGIPLTKSEKEYVNIYSIPNFRKGNLLVWQRRYDMFEWVIDMGNDSVDGLRRKVLYKNNNNIEEIYIFKANLYSYPYTEKLIPQSSKNMLYDESHIYETYILD